MPKTCPSEYAGYDGWFGIYCEREIDHEGLHKDLAVRWWDLRDGPLPQEPDDADS